MGLMDKERAPTIHAAYARFEKKHGDRAAIEDAILARRRAQYEDSIAATPHNYDAWFDLVWLEESIGDLARCRDVYERSVKCVPPSEEKRLWSRYIYLWIYYAVFEELVAKAWPRWAALRRWPICGGPDADVVVCRILREHARFSAPVCKPSHTRSSRLARYGSCLLNSKFARWI